MPDTADLAPLQGAAAWQI